jgi:hypothetical protein
VGVYMCARQDHLGSKPDHLAVATDWLASSSLT